MKQESFRYISPQRSLTSTLLIPTFRTGVYHKHWITFLFIHFVFVFLFASQCVPYLTFPLPVTDLDTPEESLRSSHWEKSLLQSRHRKKDFSLSLRSVSLPPTLHVENRKPRTQLVQSPHFGSLLHRTVSVSKTPHWLFV